ncbi:hypothetical protein TNCV_2843641 [Trichonephila clavipes]|nr:hypothetical protein TNCV_2843641 [Trichonephila clavipes]
MEYHSELVQVLGNNALPYRTVARSSITTCTGDAGTIASIQTCKQGINHSLWDLSPFLKKICCRHKDLGENCKKKKTFQSTSWTCFIAFKSNEWTGHSIRSSVSRCRYWLTIRAVCILTLSSINKPGVLLENFSNSYPSLIVVYVELELIGQQYIGPLLSCPMDMIHCQL